MRCPGCGEEVRPQHSICPYCDEVLDDSFLDDTVDQAGSGEGAFEAYDPEPDRRTKPELPAYDGGQHPADETTSKGPVPPPARRPEPDRKDVTERKDFEELNDAFSAVTERLQAMTLMEKLGAVAAFVVFAGSLMPWVDRGRSDWLIGTDLGGWVTAIGGLVCAVLTVLLPRRKVAPLASAALGVVAVLLALAALTERGSAALGLLLTLLGGAGLGATAAVSLFPRLGKRGKR